MGAVGKVGQLRLVEDGNVTARTRLQEGADHRGTERPGAAGDDHAAILKIHLAVPLARFGRSGGTCASPQL